MNFHGHQLATTIKAIFSNLNRAAFTIAFPQSKNDKDNLKWKTLTGYKINVLYLAAHSGTRQNAPQGDLCRAEDETSSLPGLWRAARTSLGKWKEDSAFACAPLQREASPLLSLLIICYTNNSHVNTPLPSVPNYPFVSVSVGLCDLFPFLVAIGENLSLSTKRCLWVWASAECEILMWMVKFGPSLTLERQIK